MFKPSDSNYEVVEKLVCKRLSGDPLNLKGFTLFQDKNPYDANVSSASASLLTLISSDITQILQIALS